jgi:hypothetical protein
VRVTGQMESWCSPDYSLDNATFAASVIIKASSDANGNQHAGTTAVRGPAKVTCLSATQSVTPRPGDPPPTCYVVGPGVAAQVHKGTNVGTSGAGTVTLTCNGQGALTCSVRVDD